MPYLNQVIWGHVIWMFWWYPWLLYLEIKAMSLHCRNVLQHYLSVQFVNSFDQIAMGIRRICNHPLMCLLSWKPFAAPSKTSSNFCRCKSAFKCGNIWEPEAGKKPWEKRIVRHQSSENCMEWKFEGQGSGNRGLCCSCQLLILPWVVQQTRDLTHFTL